MSELLHYFLRGHLTLSDDSAGKFVSYIMDMRVREKTVEIT